MSSFDVEAVGTAVVGGHVDLPISSLELVGAIDHEHVATVLAGHQPAAFRDYGPWKKAKREYWK